MSLLKLTHFDLLDTNSEARLFVSGSPLEDLGLLQEQGARIALIMKAGESVKNALA